MRVRKLSLTVRAKLFLSIFVTNALLIGCFVFLALAAARLKLREDFYQRYQSTADLIGYSINQAEHQSEAAGLAALQYLKEYESNHGLPSDEKLRSLAAELAMEQFSIIDRHGRFIADTKNIATLRETSLFDLCAGYRALLSGASAVETTPILPGFSDRKASKFVMVPNAKFDRILDVGVKIDFVEKTLRKAMASDGNLNSIGLFTASGDSLGFIDAAGIFTSGIEKNDLPAGFESISLSGRELTMVSRVAAPSENCCECRAKNIASGDGLYYYLLRLNIDLAPLNAALASIRDRFIGYFVLSILASLLLAQVLSMFISRRLRAFTNRINAIMASGNLSERMHLHGNDEIGDMARSFDEMLGTMELAQKGLLESEKDKAFASLANQVAHDIRSPLAALNSILRDEPSLPKDRRDVVSMALCRIGTIVSDLNMRLRRTQQKDADTSELSYVNAVCEYVVQEKKQEYWASKPQVSISFLARNDLSHVYVGMSFQSLVRILSNLVNNAIEAIEGEGKVVVSALQDEGHIHISVKDDGAGIDLSYLERVFDKGFSSKGSARGLGLHDAKRVVEAVDGTITVRSCEGQGSEFVITLPKIAAPSYLMTDLKIARRTRAILAEKVKGSLKQLSDALREQKVDVVEVDSEKLFSTGDKTQFDDSRIVFIETPVGEAEEVYARCQSSRVANSFIPVVDTLMTQVALDLSKKFRTKILLRDSVHCLRVNFFDVPPKTETLRILVDDDAWIRDAWELSARRQGKVLLTFDSPEQMLLQAHILPKDAVIYVDQYFNDEPRGTVLVEELYKLGFKDLYLATTEQTNDLPRCVRGVAPKEPPSDL